MNIGPEWHCDLCGNYSTDFEERGRTWQDHLDFHQITQERYDHFVHDRNGGTSLMKVKLVNWSNNIDDAILTFISQTWGAIDGPEEFEPDEREKMIEIALSGRTLPQVLETINFTFQIEGISRACSHQLVRVRIGSGFTQKGQSDVYYGDTNYIIPPMIEAVGKTDEYIALMEQCSRFYRELFEAGVPYQDARFVIPTASTTTIAWTVNMLALKNWCAQRLQNFMQWEINALARMVREEVRKISPQLANVLRPRCEITGSCQAFGNLFGGCGKFPLPQSHSRYLFSADQNKNVRFDEASVLGYRTHNQHVPRASNHWQELAREMLQMERNHATDESETGQKS